MPRQPPIVVFEIAWNPSPSDEGANIPFWPHIPAKSSSQRQVRMLAKEYTSCVTSHSYTYFDQC